ncbi:MAG: 3-dehydroquinate synthase [Candidatus Mcinerneyibacterium aminivorans]|uniref:3-dehydroquinate synthase n=1 Tax=Candidatus Mcinerneyibacterium aminivorans TaxID=2703815 RepID=A0A5D0MDH6_9BACT|nr:MAG: 3-dehydroquinate synthase [Candidatus Mcinerneyibacterium aminivorans]
MAGGLKVKTIKINGIANSSSIYINENFQNAKEYIDNENTIVLIDSNFYKLYEDNINFDKIIKIKNGENTKNLKTIENIIEQLINLKADRNTFLLGIGGGVITDITGFAGSVYMRGIDFGFISTTLLGQVDAALGGKNGVNYDGYKNIIGTFNQPKFVISDIKVLKTLSREHIVNGLAEILKYGLIYDRDFFNYLEKNCKRILQLDEDVLEYIIYKSSKIKAEIVNKDEKEKNLRKILNFGHTFGHAIEREYGMLHGKAVSIGMMISVKISKYLNRISEKEYGKIINIFDKLELPKNIEFDPEKIFSNIKKDKKKEKNSLKYILLENIGEAKIENYTFDELRTLYRKITL